MEFSSPFTMNSSKLSAITDFLFLRKTSQALNNGMMKNHHVPLTNGDQILGVHPWGLKRSFPKPNNVPTLHAQKIVKNVPFPVCSQGFPGGQPNDKCISCFQLLVANYIEAYMHLAILWVLALTLTSKFSNTTHFMDNSVRFPFLVRVDYSLRRRRKFQRK